jgi:site-specific DNA recombinase
MGMMQLPEATNKRVRVAIYARVSTEEQAEHGYSIDAQLDNLRQWCKLYGREVAGEYVDRGISGKEMTKRHELQKLLRDAERGCFEEVLTWRINRMSRKTKDLLEIVEHLNKHNVYFRSFSENFDTSSAMGKFALQMMGAVGELERNTIVDNVKLGLKQRARMGYHNGGICLGYQSVELPGGDRKHRKSELRIVPEEAAIVRKIFDLYVSGRGFRSIANQLNREGHRTKKQNPFGTDSIREIVTNPVYAGIVRYNRFEGWSEKRRRGKNPQPILTEGKHEAIIGKEIWDKAQLVFGQKSKACPRQYDGVSLLTGLIRCPECGTPMVASRSHYRLKDGTKVAQRYYSCGKFKSQGSSVCHANSVRAEQAELAVLNRLREVLLHPKVLADLVGAVNRKKAGNIDLQAQELKNIERSLERLASKRQKITELYEMDGLDRETLVRRLEELAEEQSALYARKAELEYDLGDDSCQAVPVEAVQELLQRLSDVLQRASPEQKKTLLHMAIREISLDTAQQKNRIAGIRLWLDEKLDAYLKEEAPSATQAEGAFAMGRGKFRRFSFVI